jgi:hypothetical protein
LRKERKGGGRTYAADQLSLDQLEAVNQLEYQRSAQDGGLIVALHDHRYFEPSVLGDLRSVDDREVNACNGELGGRVRVSMG